jgi:hypothetical protein
MYFDDGRRLNQSSCRNSETANRINPTKQPAQEFTCRGAEHRAPLMGGLTTPATGGWKTERVLDAANNKLQELMQLLYLLSRDPAVPNDARFHVTVAQSEIALLTRQMQNSATAKAGENQLPRPQAATTNGNL